MMAGTGRNVDITTVLEQGMTALENLPPALYQAVSAALASAFEDVFFVATAITMVAFGLSWFLEELPLRSNRSSAPNSVS